MARFDVKLNSRDIAKYLRSGSVQRRVDAEAQRRAAAAGTGYEASSYTTGNRARASVRTATGRARSDNAKNQTLLRVFGSKR